MANIRESRFLTVDSKIIKRKDVQSLASILWQEYQFDKEKDLHTGFDITIRCVGDSVFDSGDMSILDEGVLPSSKRVRGITLSYRGFGRDSFIEVDLSHGDSKYDNGVSVKGTDSTWVNGTLSKISQIIEGFQPQNTFITKYKNWVNAALSIGTGFLLSRILFFFAHRSIKHRRSSMVSICTDFSPLALHHKNDNLLFYWFITCSLDYGKIRSFMAID